MITPRRDRRLRTARIVRAAVSACAALAVAIAAERHGHRAALPAALTAAAVWNGIYATRLIRRAVDSCHADAQPETARWRSASVRCRRTGFLGLGLAGVALTGGATTVLYVWNGLHHELPIFVVGGLVATSIPFVPALLLLPGAASNRVARLRRMLDAASVGICLLFTSWVLIITPEGRIDSPGFWIAILTCCLLSLMVLTVLRAHQQQRRAALACGGAVALTVVGLNGIASGLAGDLFSGWTTAFVALLLVAPVLAWTVAAAPELIETTMQVGEEASLTFAGYPVLAVPAAAAIAVALYHLVTGGTFDRPSVLLGVVGIVVIAVRETLGAFDVARYARRVVEQEAQFRNLVAGSSDVIMVLDGELIVRWQSPAAARRFGLSDQDVVGRHFQSMIHPLDASDASVRLAAFLHDRASVWPAHRAYPRGGSGDCATAADDLVERIRASVRPPAERPNLIEARLRDGFGRWRETESSVSDQRHVPEVAGLVLHIRDVSERKEMERTVHSLTYADQLTGLANRRQVLRTIGGLRAVPRVGGAMLLIELDGFTAVNDVRGYEIGDAVLVEVARRLRTGAGPGDLAARLSGDEFAIVTEASPVRAYALATRLVTMLAEPVVLPGVTVHLSASAGMTDLASGDNGDDVLRRADLALRRAKQLGRGRVEWYDAAVEEALLRRMILEQELPGALDRGELDLIYQPILDLVAGRPLAVEALLRWRHPRLGTLLPADVIPVAEDLGLIGSIGGWVLNQATRQLSTWLHEGRDLSVAVNVSPRQFESGLTDDVAEVLRQYGVPAERLVLELAEWGLTPEIDPVAACLGELRSRGVRTALDDFGTAADSLTHLRRLPMDIVKIGRSFFDGESTAGLDRSCPTISATQPALPGLAAAAGALTPAGGLSPLGAGGVASYAPGGSSGGFLSVSPAAHPPASSGVFSSTSSGVFPSTSSGVFPASPAARGSAPIIDVMVGLSRRLGLDVVAQGLEEPAHLNVVRGAGCRMGQGHLFARPQPAERIEAYLDRFPTR